MSNEQVAADAGGDAPAAKNEPVNWGEVLDFDKQSEGAGCNDPLWVVIFLVQFLFFMYLGIDAISWFGGDSPICENGTLVADNSSCTPRTNIKVIVDFFLITEADMTSMSGSCGLGLVLVMFYSIAWLYTMRAVEGKVIYTSVVALLIIQWLVPIMFGESPMMEFYAVYDVIMILVVWWCRDSIPLVEAILANALQILHENWAPIGISYFFVFLSVAIQGIYIFAFMSLLMKMIASGESVSQLELIAFYVSYCWTKNVCQGIVHFTIAGVAASWALLGSDAPAPTMGAMKRAITTSFGTICYSGIVVTFAELAEWLLKQACCAPRTACPCLVSCIFDWIAEMIRMYNVYTLSECAVFGVSYCEGVSRFNTVFCSKGMDVITLCVLTVVPYTVAANGGFWIIFGLIQTFIADVGLGIFSFLMIVCMYIFGNNIVYATICMVESAVATVFIIWSEDAAGFAANQPDQFKKICDASQADPSVVQSFADKGGFPAEFTGGAATN